MMQAYEDMNHDPRAVANAFLDLADSDNISVTPMKLLKLIYYAYGWCLALTDKRLFTEGIQAWKYGPVVPSVYYVFKEYGNSPITGRAMNTIGEPVRLSHLPGDKDDTEFVRALLKKIWSEYKKYSAIRLSNAAHAPGTPWHQTVKECGGTIISSRCIDDGVIQEYFGEQTQPAGPRLPSI